MVKLRKVFKQYFFKILRFNDLIEVNLNLSNLTGANLTEANLQATYFWATDFRYRS
ncbi:pentapeptide repeat-containing protein [Dapis sp. BLCC M172]|uniref:pentapeptide repeat-containing protein n=1 Tax=Dapis sp. BLCC M172 TaxID=2975281 RepID=UPI003CEB6A4F